MTSQPFARSSGSILWWMKVTEWKIQSPSSQWLSARATLQPIESCSQARPCKTTWLSCGVYLTFCCPKFLTPVMSSKSGSINLCRKCTQSLPKHLRKKTTKSLNFQKKSSYSSSTDCIKFCGLSSWGESSQRSKRSCHPSLNSLLKCSCPPGRKWFTMASLSTVV